MVGKFDKDKISNGKDFAKVNISLDIDGEEYVVSRKVTKQGKNLCTINGEMVSKENQNILDISKQRNMLDRYIHKYIEGIRRRIL